MKKYIFLIIAYILMVMSFLINWGTFDSQIQKTIYLIAPLITIGSGIWTLGTIGWTGKRAKTLLLVLCGTILWLCGEVTILYLDIYHLDPYPSIGDAFFLLGYPLFMTAAINEWRVFELNMKKLDRHILITMGAIGLSVTTLVLYLGLVVGHDPAATFLVNLVGFSWSLGDLVVGMTIMLMLGMIWEYRDGKIKHAWIAFMLWGILNLTADTIYGIFPEALLDGSVLSIALDSMWVAGYFLISFYFLEIGGAIVKIQKIFK